MHALNDLVAKDGFRLRGRNMSRIDAFSDVVFGFALTLIVVSLEVPKTYAELHELLLGFFPFGICFTFLIMLWWAHFRFFRRYGLHDFGTILINSILLFLLLFYVYPLKFLFTITVHSIFGEVGASVFQSNWQIREMMLVYSLGFAAVYFAVAGLYMNAWRLRDDMKLNVLERALTRNYIEDFSGVASIGVAAAILAMTVPIRFVPKTGYVFFAIGIFKTIHGNISGKRERIAREKLRPEDNQPLHHLPH